nr:hypothetical protein [Marinobacter fuscus]
MFGSKSEKQVYDLPEQDSLFQPDEAPLPEQPADEKSASLRPISAAPAKSSGRTTA